MSKNTDEYRALAAKIEKADGELKSLEKVMDGLDADTGLLLASSVPGPIGTIADVASLAKSLAAGDLGGAMWDLVGFVPFFGDAAKAIGKGGKIARHIAAIKKAIKKAKDAIAKQEKKLEKLCKGKTKKGDVDKSATSSSCPECDGVKNTKPKPKPKPKPRKPSQPDRKKWKKKGGKVKDNPDGTTTYTNKDGTSVTYNEKGYPDFSPHSPEAPVKIDGMKGDHYHDYKKANEASGRPELKDKPPEGYRWHHMEDGERMQLVKKDVHDEFSHSGGASIVKNKGK